MAVMTQLPPEVATLRSISSRIASAKPTDLPHIVASQVYTLQDCGPVLSRSWSSQAGSGANEVAVVIHRLHTQIAALLQGRHVEERWAAAILIKALVGTGGFETLSRGKHWVSGLLNALRKPDPSTTKALYILVLTRIFTLSREYPSLVRESTTPSLPQFIKSCVNNLSSPSITDKEIHAIVACFLRLIPHHPTIFRTFVKDIADLQRSIIAQHGEVALSIETRTVLARLSPVLHCCAPKQGALIEQTSAISAILENCHHHTDIVLKLVEHGANSGTASATNRRNGASAKSSAAETHFHDVNSSAEMLKANLENLTAYILTDSGAVVNFPITEIQNLVTRLLSVVVSQRLNLPKFNASVSKDERDACTTVLPRIHVSVLHIVEALFHRFEVETTNLTPSLLQQIQWVFDAENDHADVRTACYLVSALTIRRLGMSMSKRLADLLSPIVKNSCKDVNHSERDANQITLATSLSNGNKQKSSSSADRELANATITSRTALQKAAAHLVEAFIVSVPRSLISDILRTQLDRTAILTGDGRLMAASVLNPSKRKDGRHAPSLVPFLGRLDNVDAVTEALLRPRAPVIFSGDTNDYQPLFNDADDIIPLAGSAQTMAPTDDPAVGLSTVEEPEVATLIAPVSVTAANEDHSSLGRKRSLEQNTNIETPIENKSKRVKELEPVNTEVKPTFTEESIESIQSSDTAASMAVANPAASAQLPKPSPLGQGAQQQTVESDDDDDFVIPDLDMDVSDESGEE